MTLCNKRFLKMNFGDPGCYAFALRNKLTKEKRNYFIEIALFSKWLCSKRTPRVLSFCFLCNVCYAPSSRGMTNEGLISWGQITDIVVSRRDPAGEGTGLGKVWIKTGKLRFTVAPAAVMTGRAVQRGQRERLLTRLRFFFLVEGRKISGDLAD